MTISKRHKEFERNRPGSPGYFAVVCGSVHVFLCIFRVAKFCARPREGEEQLGSALQME